MTSHDAQSQGANPSNRSTAATSAAFDDLAPRPVTALDLFFELVFVAPFGLEESKEFHPTLE